MAHATPSRLGQINAANDADALFLKVFGGEVLTAFEESTAVLDKHIVRTIKEGKSAQFPATWKLDAYYHVPGEEITGNKIKHGERDITIDDLLIAPVFLANIDEAKNHYDVRSIYSKEAGSALARHFDTNVLRTGLLAARANGTIEGSHGGAVIEKANLDTNSDTLADSLFEAAKTLDEKDVPAANRYVYLKPQQYYNLAQNTKVLNKDWDGKGSYSDGKVIKIADITIIKTNNLPTTNVGDGPAKYRGDFRNTVGLIMHTSGVGTVKLLDIAVESQYDIRRQGHLTVAKMAIGSGILRPECCIELKKRVAQDRQ